MLPLGGKFDQCKSEYFPHLIDQCFIATMLTNQHDFIQLNLPVLCSEQKSVLFDIATKFAQDLYDNIHVQILNSTLPFALLSSMHVPSGKGLSMRRRFAGSFQSLEREAKVQMWVALRKYPNSNIMKLSNQYTKMYQHPTIYITSVICWVMLKINLNITNKHLKNNCHNTVLSPRKVPCFLSPRIHPTDEPEDSCPTEEFTRPHYIVRRQQVDPLLTPKRTLLLRLLQRVQRFPSHLFFCARSSDVLSSFPSA